MVETQLPFHVSTADRLMLLARHGVISNSAYTRNLPPSWYILSILAQLSDTQFLKQLRTGAIHPEMEQSLLLKESKTPLLLCVEVSFSVASLALPGPATYWAILTLTGKGFPKCCQDVWLVANPVAIRAVAIAATSNDGSDVTIWTICSLKYH